MDKPQAPEAAETARTTDSPAVDLPRLVRLSESPHRCSTLLCGAPATWRRPKNNYLGEHLGWVNCCPICFTRNHHDRELLWEKIILPNVDVEARGK